MTAMAEPPARVREAIERCARAALIFDEVRLAENAARIAAAARAADLRALFAVKSFPHPRAIAIAAAALDGFDVASPGELALVPASASAIVSVADPTGLAIARARAARVIVACETIEQVAAAPPGAAIAIRISASLTERDPAIGAIHDGDGRRRSRFGLDDPAQIAALAAAARADARALGLHVHHGPVTATSAARFIATARAALELAARAGVAPAFVDLGGAWHGIADLAVAFAEIRAALPRELELIVEPGRALAAGAGFACGLVRAARTLGGGGDRELRVVDLSRTAHLRWSPIELVARAPHAGAGRRVIVVGPTCYEEDVLGEWTVEPAALDRRVVVSGVTGYALAWNTGFGGVPPADVVFA